MELTLNQEDLKQALIDYLYKNGCVPKRAKHVDIMIVVKDEKLSRVEVKFN